MFKFHLYVLFLTGSLLAGADKEIIIREDFAATPPEFPITQKHIVNKDLTLGLHGDKMNIKKSHHANKKNDPHYVWSGLTKSVWAVSLALKDEVSLGERSLHLSWRTKQSGGRTLYFILQNEEGKWFIYNEGSGDAKDWNESSFSFDKTKWSSFDISIVKKGEKLPELNIKSIKSIGFTDLQRGAASKASSRLDWLELRIK